MEIQNGVGSFMEIGYWLKFGDSGSPWNMKGIRCFHVILVIGLCKGIRSG